MKNYRLLTTLLVLVAVIGIAAAQKAIQIPNITINMGGSTLPGQAAGAAASKNPIATSLQILALLTVLSLAPAILILTTAFTRIVIIFSFLRSALGTPTIPPNQVVIGLSLFLTFFVMKPTFQAVNDQAIKPAMAGTMSYEQFLDKATPPVRDFMLRSTYQSDLKMFLNIRGEHPHDASELQITTLIPAFVISELKTAFIIGFYIFIPFLIVDLIVASALMSMGMMMLPPTVVSLPAKILVFVLADGWANLISAIMAGYR